MSEGQANHQFTNGQNQPRNQDEISHSDSRCESSTSVSKDANRPKQGSRTTNTSSRSVLSSPPSKRRETDTDSWKETDPNSSPISSTSTASPINRRNSFHHWGPPGSALSCGMRSRIMTPKFSSRGRTPNVGTSSVATGSHNIGSYIVALVEGRGLAKGEVGMASLDLKNPELILSQFPDSPSYAKVVAKLQIYNPIEIIMPITTFGNQTVNNLVDRISELFPDVNITTVQRKYFNEDRGIQCIRHLCVPEYSFVEMEVSSKYYCLASAAALLQYIEFTQNIVFAPKSLKILFRASEKTAMIDAMTSRNLELIINQCNMKSDHTLYGVLQPTRTAGGYRLLRANILQPPTDVETITTRQDCISELIGNQEFLHSLQSILSRFLDVEHIIFNVVQIQKHEPLKVAEDKITNTLYLRHILELVDPLCVSLERGQHSMFKLNHDILKDPRLGSMLEDILTIINEDARYTKGTLNMRTQRCFAIKANINGLLDVARKVYSETVDDIYQMVKQLAETYNLPLQPAYNATRGFFIQMTKHTGLQETDLPDVFIQITKAKNMISFTTEHLNQLNDRATASLHEVYLMSNTVITCLMDRIRAQIGCLYKLSEVVSTLDMLVAFAHVATLYNYTRPEFADTTVIKNGKHPILMSQASKTIVPNSTFLSEDTNFIVITGPNMSGKTTYLKQIALLQIMAQLGSFIPVEQACFRITDQVFSRMGSNDDIETNCSTFMVEMKEINYILQNATDTSLILIDELGRGTSVEEGVGLCYAICESLANTKAFTAFATHFKDITKLERHYTNVCNYHFKVEHMANDSKSPNKVIYKYTHLLDAGPCLEEHYGLKAAEIAHFPQKVLQDAHEIASKLERQEKSEENDADVAVNRIEARLAEDLIQLARYATRTNPDVLRERLKDLKIQYEKDMARVHEE